MPKKPVALGKGVGKKQNTSVYWLLHAAFIRKRWAQARIVCKSVSKGGKEQTAIRNWGPWKIRKVKCFCHYREQKIEAHSLSKTSQ